MNKQTLAIVCLAISLISGCGSTKPIQISLSPWAAQSIDDTQSVAISATLIHDSKSQGVKWSATGSGSLTGQTSTGATFQAPASGAASSATITATSVADPKSTVSLTISLSPLPAFGALTLPDATEGVAYSQSVTATGGTGARTYALASGTLPAGLSLNGSTGTITGTPAGPTGKSTFTVKVTDSSMAGAQSATSGPTTITVGLPLAPSISTTSLPGGTVGTAYSQAVTATGGVAPLTFSISPGALPGGLTISGSGIITGTPTAAGTFTFTVNVSDSATPTPQTGTKQLSIDVAAAVSPLSVTTSTLAGGSVNAAYSATLNASGGTPPLTWSVTVGSLPTGLSLDSSTGVISGTPTANGTSNFTVQVADSGAPQQTATKALSITIAAVTASCSPANTGSESLLNGQYAMVLEGYDLNGAPVLLGATFDADGAGHLANTVGVEDSVQFTGVQLAVPIDGTASSYNVGSDHRGCMSVVTSSGTQIFRFAVGAIVAGVATRAQAIEADNTGTALSGTVYLQDTTAFSVPSLVGNYAFGIAAPLKGTGRTKYAAAGIFSLDGNFSVSGEMDVNDSGTFNGNGTTFPAGPISIVSNGTYSVNTNGRGKLSFTPGLGANQSNAIIYVISASKFLIMSFDSEASFPVFVGDATLQTGAPFSSASMNANAVFATIGVQPGTSSETEARVGLLQPQLGKITYQASIAGGNGSFLAPVTYAVDAAGRVQVANSGTGAAILYLSGPNQGYILFMGTNLFTNAPDVTVSSGFFVPQTGAPFNDLTMGGGNWALGSLGADSVSSTHSDGNAIFGPNPAAFGGVVNGKTDTNTNGSIVGSDYSLRFLIADPDSGSVQWTDQVLTIQSVGFIISPNAILAIDSTINSAPTLLYYVAQ